MRRRSEKPTVRLDRVPTLREVAASWHAQLNTPAALADAVVKTASDGRRAGTNFYAGE